MTRNDMDKLAALLGALYPRLPKLSPTALAAWYIILKPYEYADVRENLIAWNRGPKGRNYPDARELIPETAVPEPDETPRDRPQLEDFVRMKGYLYGIKLPWAYHESDRQLWIDGIQAMIGKMRDEDEDRNLVERMLARLSA